MDTTTTYEHLMVDIETMGTFQNSVIVAIGAVQFDLSTGETGNTFSVTIDLESMLRKNFDCSGETIKWWINRDSKAKEIFNVPSLKLKDALDEFSAFARQTKYIWGNGSSFDLGVIANAYERLNMNAPWHHWNERDVRTLVMFDPSIKKHTEFIGTAHHPIDDCFHQIKYCSQIWKKYGTDNQANTDNK